MRKMRRVRRLKRVKRVKSCSIGIVVNFSFLFDFCLNVYVMIISFFLIKFLKPSKIFGAELVKLVKFVCQN